MRFPLPNLYESEYFVPMTFSIALVSSPDYFDIHELVGAHVEDPTTMLRLTNSIVDKMNEVVNREVDDALDSAESPFRRIMDGQEQELQALYRELHSVREENARLIAQVNNPTSFRGPNATEKGIAFALKDAETLQNVKEGRKINAIKRVRAETFIGLKEAKDAVESLAVVEAADWFCHAECME